MEMYYDNHIFADNLTRLLKEKGAKAIDLAKFLGVSKVSVSEWVHGKKLPRMDKVDKMCVFFNCTRSDLIDEKREPAVAPTDSKTEMIIKMFNALTPEQESRAFDFLLSLIQEK